MGGLLATMWFPALAHTARAGNSMPVLRWYGLSGTATWAQTLDPAMVTDTISGGILNMTDANLVKYLPDGTTKPYLATWKVSKNRKVYTFTIRKNARFANGDPVTAQDAAWSITRSLSKATNSPTSLQDLSFILGAPAWNSGKAKSLAGVKALNTRQVQITLSKPVAFFIGALAGSNADVLDKRVVNGHPSQTYLTTTCSANQGAGPFTFKCRNKGTGMSSFYPAGTTPQITLVPNKYFFGPKPHITVNMRAIVNTDTNYRVFQANGIDVTDIPTADIATNRGKPGYYQYPTLQMWYLSPDPKVAPFTNVHCRLALSYAINYEAIDNQILHGSMTPLYDMVPKGVLGYYNGADNPHYNTTKAKAELAQCPGGIHNVKLVYMHTSSDWDNVYGNALPSMFGAVGIGVKGDPLPFNDWLKDVTQPQSKTNTAIAQNGLTAFPDPWNFCTILLRGGEPFNSGEYNNPAVNQILDRADVTANRQKRAQLYIKAQHMAIMDGGVMPIGQSIGYALVKPWVKGLVASATFDELVPRNNDWSQVSVNPH
jgi:ABC-type transport system substrate-binding protein